MVLGGQKLECEKSCVIIKKYDEVALVVRSFNRDRTAQIRVNKFQKAGGGRRL